MHIDKTGQDSGRMHEDDPHEATLVLPTHETVDYCGRRALSRVSIMQQWRMLYFVLVDKTG